MTRIQKVYSFTNEEVNTLMFLIRKEMNDYEDKVGCHLEQLSKTEKERYDMLKEIYMGF